MIVLIVLNTYNWKIKIAYVFTGARCLRSYSTFVLYSMAGWSHKAALMESLIIGKLEIILIFCSLAATLPKKVKQKVFFSGIIRLPTTLIPVFLVDRLGRRPMLIGSTGACFASLLIMLAGIDIGPDWKVTTVHTMAPLWAQAIRSDSNTDRINHSPSDKRLWNRLTVSFLLRGTRPQEHPSVLGLDTHYVWSSHQNRSGVRILSAGQCGESPIPNAIVDELSLRHYDWPTILPDSWTITIPLPGAHRRFHGYDVDVSRDKQTLRQRGKRSTCREIPTDFLRASQ